VAAARSPATTLVGLDPLRSDTLGRRGEAGAVAPAEPLLDKARGSGGRYVADWFDFDGDSPYMLLVAGVAPGHRLPLSPAEEGLRGLERLGRPAVQVELGRNHRHDPCGANDGCILGEGADLHEPSSISSRDAAGRQPQRTAGVPGIWTRAGAGSLSRPRNLLRRI